MHPWCSETCSEKWSKRNEFLFDLKTATSLRGQQALGLVIYNETFDDDPSTLVRLSQVSKTLRPLAMEHEVGKAFHKPGVHYKSSPKSAPVRNSSDGSRPGKRRALADNAEVSVTADQMLDIALMAYNTAIELRGKNLPVILYRHDSKSKLKSEEKKQTVSSSVHAFVGNTEVWPLQKTAAWIQGAMRACVSFVLLDDPRKPGILIGGIDKASDAVYVRELYQIIQTKYTIGIAGEQQTPERLRQKKLFILQPPKNPLGRLPLVPRINANLDWSHTWDSSKSSLALNDSPMLIRNHLVQVFEEEGKKLRLRPY
jgi:hypothetical protein